MIPVELLSSAAIGLLVGLVSSVLGLGGGIVIVPLLPLVAGISARETIGTSLLTVFFVTAINTWNFHRMKLVVWRSALLIGVFAALGSFTAATLTGYVEIWLLYLVMGLVLSGLTLITLFPTRTDRSLLPHQTAAQRNFSSGTIGLMSGVVSGFTGIGGGVLITPLLAKLKSFARTEIVPTSNAAIVLTSLAGTLAFVKAGHDAHQGGLMGLVRWDLAIALFLGAQVTSVIGRRIQGRFDPRKRDWLIGFLLLALSAKTLISAVRAM